MTIFALDTSTRTGSMALLRAGVVTSRVGDAAKSHAERLPAEAMDFLGQHGIALSDVDVFAVISGPGSFTGLRVGAAAVQGWAFATARPVVAVPTLDAVVASIAADVASTHITVPCLDALRGEVFFGAHDDRTWRVEASVGSAAEMRDVVGAIAADRPVAIVGDAAAKCSDVWMAAGWRAVESVMTLAEAALRLADGGAFQPLPPHAVRLHYVRRTDAEIARDRRLAAQ